MKVLIFGGTGSLGKAIIKRFIPKCRVVACSRDEAKHWTMTQSFRSHPNFANLTFRVGDVRDKQRVREVIVETDPDAIIMAAALKQVDTCELSPRESILTNLQGTQNVVETLDELGGNRTLLFVSTDKACAPTNVYGMCKALSERYVTSKGGFRVSPRFIAVRYGNVLESRGSIIPLFRYQAEFSEAFTVTHPEMTRFIMTLDDSVNLIEHALHKAENGTITIPTLHSMRISDLAEIFSERFNKPVKYIGLRPGEKLHEALISEPESVRATRLNDHWVILPSSIGGERPTEMFEYSSGQSERLLTKLQLADYLQSIGILDRRLDEFEGKSIEEIRTV